MVGFSSQEFLKYFPGCIAPSLEIGVVAVQATDGLQFLQLPRQQSNRFLLGSLCVLRHFNTVFQGF